MLVKLTDKVFMHSDELYARVRKANGLRGRQTIIDHDREFDGWVFYSNARGGYGELLSFHYLTTDVLLRDLEGSAVSPR